MHRRRPLIGTVAVVMVVLGLVVRYQMTGPRLKLVATMRSPLGLQGCLVEVRGLGSGQDPQLCADSPGKQWFHATVTNVGGRGAWVSTCWLQGYDSADTLLVSADVPMWLTQEGIGARPYLAPGHSASLDWFMPTAAPTKPAHLVGTCGYVVYRHPPI
jgi:hypothetical protein